MRNILINEVTHMKYFICAMVNVKNSHLSHQQFSNQNGASSEDSHLPPSSRGVGEYDSDYLFHIPPLLYRKRLGEGTDS